MSDKPTGLRVLAWRHLYHIEVVEIVLNDLSAPDRERDLALRLLEVLEAVKWDSTRQRNLRDHVRSYPG